MIAEKRLFCAVVVQAVTDATYDGNNAELLREKHLADTWLRSGGKNYHHICALAGIDPEFIRDAYVSGRIDAKRLRNGAST